MTRIPYVAIAALLLLGPVGCRGGDDDDDTPDGGTQNADANPEGDNTIFQIQTPGELAEGTAVTLKNVVVTAIDTYGNNMGGMYVEEPQGGAYSGVYLFQPTIPATMPVVGDLVDVSGGVIQEFALTADTTGRKLTEVGPAEGGEMTVVKVGTGTVPAAEVVNPATLAGSDDEAEKWEGVLIKFENVAVLADPSPATPSDPTLFETTVSGPFLVDSSLADISTMAGGQCLASLTGIGTYFFDYKMLPRSAADIVDGGSGCGTTTETICDDELDDDGDGFVDCDDRDCAGNAACAGDTVTVQDVQNGTVAVDTAVTIEGLVVTAITANKKNVFLKDPAGGEYSGVLAFNGGTFTDATIVPGAIVNVSGTVSEYHGLTELGSAVITVTGSGTVPAAHVLTAAQMTDAATAEKWEAVLVKLDNVSVVTVPDSYGEWTVGSPAVIVDDFLFVASPTVGDCYSITGVMNQYDVDTNANGTEPDYKLEPRSAADIVDGTCG